MGAPLSEMEPVENPSAEALLDSLKTIDPGERRKHASVFNYWLSIRGDRQFPPIRDLDPLEISDAGPWSLLLEMIGGGEDAVVRHLGQEIRGGVEVEKICDAPSPSLLSCVHGKLPIVAACREAFAFEETFDSGDGPRRCWVTLLPFSGNGTWIDYVYGYVSLEGAKAEVEPEPTEEVEADAAVELAEDPETPAEAIEEAVAEEPADELPEETGQEVSEAEPVTEALAEEEPEPFKVPLAPLDELEEMEAEPLPVEVPPELEHEPVAEAEAEPEFEPEPEPEVAAECEPEAEPEPDDRPSFTARFKESLASVGGFYGKVVQSGPELPADSFVEEEYEAAYVPEAPAEEPVATGAEDAPEESVSQPAYAVEGSLQNKLTDVRALAEEAREAQVRSNMALYEGLSAAYDFALDAEDAPEEYLRLVEAQGLKIQLRSPMKPVVKLAFDGMCDEPTIKQLEAVLAWALKHDLPRGTLADRIQEEGGIGPILSAKAA